MKYVVTVSKMVLLVKKNIVQCGRKCGNTFHITCAIVKKILN